jgi:O-methyltransferase domain
MPGNVRHPDVDLTVLLVKLVADTLPRSTSPKTAYILRQICHDWDDSRTLNILRSVRAVIGNCGATLLIVEVRVAQSAECDDHIFYSMY